MVLQGTPVATPGPHADSSSSPAASPAPKPAYFYTGKTYGSEAQFNPLSELINEGFDVLNTRGYERRVLRSPIDVGFRTLTRTLANPHQTIKDYGGYMSVVRNELLPFSADRDGGGAWTGNYGLHLLGSGMVSARMREWYAAHGASHPELAAHLTMAATHLLNETVEGSRADGFREEALPDLLLFDGLGMLLFHYPKIQRLWSNDRLSMTNWPLQPVIALPDSTIENVGQAFVIKARIPGSKHWSAFASLALSAQGGLSYRFDNGTALTFAAGTRALHFKMVDTVTQKMEVDEWGGDYTLFYDRDNSLLYALNVDQGRKTTTLNVYPSFVRIKSFAPGFFIQQAEHRVRFGIVSNWGVGLATSRVR